MISVFTSCDKLDVNNPQKKIRLIYRESNSTSKHLSEEWHWDSNLLTSIDYYKYSSREQTLDYTVHFFYTDGKLTRVILGNSGVELQITHNQYGYDKMNYFENGVLVAEFKYRYGNAKIINIDVTYINNTSYASEQAMSALSFILPQVVARNVVDNIPHHTDVQSKVKSVMSDVNTTTYSFIYKDNNVIKMTITDKSGSQDYNYKYDSKNNPYYNSPLSPSVNLWVGYSVNNIVEESGYDFLNNASVSTYSYLYDGSWPIKVYSNTRNDYSERSEITYYEYY